MENGKIKILSSYKTSWRKAKLQWHCGICRKILKNLKRLCFCALNFSDGKSSSSMVIGGSLEKVVVSWYHLNPMIIIASNLRTWKCSFSFCCLNGQLGMPKLLDKIYIELLVLVHELIIKSTEPLNDHMFIASDFFCCFEP